MCITRVGRVVGLEGQRASVRFLDNGATGEVDASMVDAKRGSYVEVFADQAIGRITRKEAEYKRSLRLQLLKRSGVASQ